MNINNVVAILYEYGSDVNRADISWFAKNGNINPKKLMDDDAYIEKQIEKYKKSLRIK